MAPFSKGLQYRIRIFDNYNHLKTVRVKITGQRYVVVVVDNPLRGDKIKMAFMISPEVKPFNFSGKELEYNYDIREATPLAALASVSPDLIAELNEDLSILLQNKSSENVVPAEFTEIKEETAISPVEPDPASVLDNAKENIKAIKQKVKEAEKVTKDASKLIKIIAHLNLGAGELRTQQIREVISLCADYPNLLYWLPKYMHLDMPVRALVSAIPLYRVGVHADYYGKQSAAEISEKVLERPKDKMGWETVVLVAAIGIFGLLFLVVIGKIIHAF